MADVFISHAESDGEIAFKISRDLEALGYSTWLYERDTLPGMVHFVQSGKSVEKCKAFIIICSEKSAKSPHVSRELQVACDNNKTIIPLLSNIGFKEFIEINEVFKYGNAAGIAKLIPEKDISPLIQDISKLFRDLGIHPNSVSQIENSVTSLQSQDASIDAEFESEGGIAHERSVQIGRWNSPDDEIIWEQAEFTKPGADILYQIASDIVIYGSMPNFETLPSVRFGKLRVVDRSEIISLRNIKNLLIKYVNDIQATGPISIATFGPPGSGQIFTIKELTRSLFNDELQFIKLNISQFSVPADLSLALRNVKSIADRGKLPIVLFEEFDAKLGETDIGWLKHFLGPMKDGEFFLDGETYTIGKAIFVFKSGESYSLEHFTPIEPASNIEPSLYQLQKSSWEKFRSAKGPEFISNLSGHINILGPNQINDGDRMFIIRRALTIRAVLEATLSYKFFREDKSVKIDKSIVSALLRIPVYKYGVKSIGAIIRLSNTENADTFDQNCLLPKDQLERYVDADTFTRWMKRENLFGASVDKIAMHIHESYLWTEIYKIDSLRAAINREVEEKVKMEKEEILSSILSKPTLKAWNDLPENSREDYRRYLDAIPIRLEQIGYKISLNTHRKVSLNDFSQEVIEEYARLEHERWMQEKFRLGWAYGPVRNDKIKTHPLLVQWEKLPELDQVFDRTTIFDIQRHLAAEGFIIEKITDENNK